MPGPKGAAETLLGMAAAKAGLLVMGGYGHGRLRERVFGGFTEHVLADAPLFQQNFSRVLIRGLPNALSTGQSGSRNRNDAER
jgi:hypothetical protein